MCHPSYTAQKENDTGVDEGGPSRQFLSDAFLQMQTLSVPVGPSGERVEFFAQATAGANRGNVREIIPCRDDDIILRARKVLKQSVALDHVYSPEEEAQIEEVMSRVGLYSRAMGRMLVRYNTRIVDLTFIYHLLSCLFF